MSWQSAAFPGCAATQSGQSSPGCTPSPSSSSSRLSAIAKTEDNERSHSRHQQLQLQSSQNIDARLQILVASSSQCSVQGARHLGFGEMDGVPASIWIEGVASFAHGFCCRYQQFRDAFTLWCCCRLTCIYVFKKRFNCQLESRLCSVP